jgi:ribosomal protein S27AE
MATEIERTVVVCGRCGEEYATWSGVGLEVLGPDPCPRCGFTPDEDPRLYDDGTPELLEDEGNR